MCLPMFLCVCMCVCVCVCVHFNFLINVILSNYDGISRLAIDKIYSNTRYFVLSIFDMKLS